MKKHRQISNQLGDILQYASGERLRPILFDLYYEDMGDSLWWQLEEALWEELSYQLRECLQNQLWWKVKTEDV